MSTALHRRQLRGSLRTLVCRRLQSQLRREHQGAFATRRLLSTALLGAAFVTASPLVAEQPEPSPPRGANGSPQTDAKPAEEQHEKSTVTVQEEPIPANYGKTPDTVIPFRNFREPYNRFFQTPVEFLGSGRDRQSAEIPQTVRIGFFGPLEPAPDADLGQHMLQGVTLAIEQANAADGYDGIPFELVTRKDLGLWGASSNEMVAFKYEDHVLAVIGSIDGANTHIALRVALKMQMPMVNTATTDPTLTETNIPWLMRCMADDRQQGYALAHHVINECGLEKLVAFRVNDRYGRTGIIEFRDAARRLKRPLRAELRWDRGERDFTIQLDRIAEIEPDAIVLWGNAADAAAIVKEIRRRKMPVRIFGPDRLASRAFLEAAGEAAEGVVAAASFDPNRHDPRLKAFVEDYSKRFNHPPETFAAHAYDGANILIAAIRKAGLNRVRIRDALYEYTHYDGVTGLIIFDTTLNDVGPVFLATVKDSRFVYREVDFTSAARTGRRSAPYRTLAQSAPVARSPDRAAHRSSSVFRIGCFLPLDEAGQAAVGGVKRAIVEDASRHPDQTPVELVVRDARGTWGENSRELVDLVFTSEVLAVIGSTGRRGTHLAEMLAAKMHFPVLTLCGTDPTIAQIPLPWVFCIAPNSGAATVQTLDNQAGDAPGALRPASLGYDAAAMLLARIRAGAHSRRTLRDSLAAGDWHEGATGTFRFNPLGQRLDTDESQSLGNVFRKGAVGLAP